ncbi:MAG TPA: glycoside hydrolase family 30 beta sandwich domain-containing protein [Marmoricola sp.]
MTRSPRRSRTALTLLVGVLVTSAFTAPRSAASSTGPTVRGYLSGPTAAMHRLKDRRFSTGAARAGTTVVKVGTAKAGTAITAGFGVAITDASASLLLHDLDATHRAAVMRELFSPSRGIGLSFLRVPIGGSDFITGGAPYTYDDQPSGRTDPDLSGFSLGRDRRTVLPVVRRARSLNPHIVVMANPWTPPAWMKTDDTLITKTPLGTLRRRYYGAYAGYLVRAVKAFERQGVPVRYLGVQNEPYTPLLGSVVKIPSSFLTGLDEGSLIHDDLAPRLRKAKLSPRIVGYDDGYQRSETFIPLMMARASGDVATFAYHCYYGDPSSMRIEGALYPDVEQLETECATNLSNIEPSEMIIRSLRNGASGVQLWNAVLDEHGGPKIGAGCVGLPLTGPGAGKDCTAPVIVNRSTHRYRLTGDFWSLTQFSRFIRRGAVRVSSTSKSCFTSLLPSQHCGVETVAYRNPDGSFVLVATTHDGHPHKLTIEQGGRRFDATLPDRATATFVWR